MVFVTKRSFSRWKEFFPQILDLAVVIAHFLQKRTSRKFLSIFYEKTKRNFVHGYIRRISLRIWERFCWDGTWEIPSALSDPTDGR